MAILDLLLLVMAIGVGVRGLVRGVQRESLDLLVLMVAVVVAFRLHAPGARLITSWAGVGNLPARFMAGGILFIAIVVAGSYAATLMARRFESEPSLGGRLLGGAVSLTWLTLLLTTVLLVAFALPLSESATSLLASSRAATGLTDPASPSYRVVTAFDQDRVLEAMINLNGAIGHGRVVIEGTAQVGLPASEDIAGDRSAASGIFDLLNLARVDADLSPLAWSEALAEVGDAHAFDMYSKGYFSHESSDTGSVADRVQAAGIPYVLVGENLALAPTVENVHDGLLASPSHAANMLEPRFRRVGIGVYRGPLGLMVVQVFSG